MSDKAVHTLFIHKTLLAEIIAGNFPSPVLNKLIQIAKTTETPDALERWVKPCLMPVMLALNEDMRYSVLVAVDIRSLLLTLSDDNILKLISLVSADKRADLFERIDYHQLMTTKTREFSLQLIRLLPTQSAIELSKNVSSDLKQTFTTIVLESCIEKNDLASAESVIRDHLALIQEKIATGDKQLSNLLLRFIILSTPDTQFKFYDLDEKTQNAIFEELTILVGQIYYAQIGLTVSSALSSILYAPFWVGLAILGGLDQDFGSSFHGHVSDLLSVLFIVLAYGAMATLGIAIVILGAIPAAISYTIDSTISAYYGDKCSNAEAATEQYEKISKNRDLFWSEPSSALDAHTATSDDLKPAV